METLRPAPKDSMGVMLARIRRVGRRGKEMGWTFEVEGWGCWRSATGVDGREEGG